MLEFKNQFRASDIYKIVAYIEKMGYLDNITFISFELKNLIYLRRRYPQVPAQYLLRQFTDKDLENLKKYNLGLDMKYINLTKEIVDKVHTAGLEVNCWTVNTKEEGEAMVAMGVDYITTNILE